MLGFLVAGAAAAQEPPEPDTAALVDIFRRHPAPEITAGLDGRWAAIAIDGLEDTPAIEDFRDRACAHPAGVVRTISVLAHGAFTIAQGPADTEVVFRLDPIGGARFSRMFDPDAVAAYLHIDQLGPEFRERTLHNLARELDVYRVAADILVLAADGNAEILMRCPA